MRSVFCVLCMLAVVFTANSLIACSGTTPNIDFIDPRIGVTGEDLQIHGKNFGAAQDESYVCFGSVIPTLSSYHVWSDELIVIRIPDFAESCLISVHRGGEQSNGVLFSTMDAMPVISPVQNTAPVISAIDQPQTSIGKIIEISGTGFGTNRDSSQVYFSWDVEKSDLEDMNEAMIPASEFQGAYESWNEHAIRVRVPDGAANGVVRVSTERGNSNGFPLSITGKPGFKTLKDKKTYSIFYSVDVRVEAAVQPNFLFLWLPVPAASFSQLNKEFLESSAEPFIKNYRGSSLYKLIDLSNEFSKNVSVAYLVDVYAVETNIQANQVRPVQDLYLQKMFAFQGSLVNSNSDGIRAKAAQIIGRETNPYLKARAIYRELLKETGTARESAFEFCALSRAANIPAIPVAGVLVNRNQQTTPHIWAQFWLESFGWVPVDITLGQGKAPENFNLSGGFADYYFGNLDNNRIAFSYGEIQLSQMNADGKTSGRENEYALQNIWEESSSGIKSYSSHWSEIAVTGIY